MSTFVMLLELNGVDMFIDALVTGVTSSYNNKTERWSRITFSPKFCNCEARDPNLMELLRNLSKEFSSKKFPFEYPKMTEITLTCEELGEITLYNRNQKIETDIDIYHCKACWNKQNWD